MGKDKKNKNIQIIKHQLFFLMNFVSLRRYLSRLKVKRKIIFWAVLLGLFSCEKKRIWKKYLPKRMMIRSKKIERPQPEEKIKKRCYKHSSGRRYHDRKRLSF